MERKEPKLNTQFSAIQNILAGIACSFYFIYKYYLSEPSVVKDLGASYPWLIQCWVIIMIFAAGLSGSKLVMFVVKYAPLFAKAISSLKKSLNEE